MPDVTHLEIQIVGFPRRPIPGDRSWNVLRGGPAVLLAWIETQLGLGAEPPTHAHRVAEYAAALEQVPDAAFAASLAVDRWATAMDLLARRDTLRLAGWDEALRPNLPPLLRDMARAAQARPLTLPGEADRLQWILAALAREQTLPRHQCLLWDPVERWPARWRQVLAHLSLGATQPQSASAAAKTQLAIAQRLVVDGTPNPITTDKSLRWLRARSIHAACEAVAWTLAQEPARVPETVICCEDPGTALVLDECLARLGLPTMGAAQDSLAHPVLQVLPLALRLAWAPVDPALLLDFLSLPVGPLPGRAAGRLAAALADQPGLGSRAWEDAMAALRLPEGDPDGTLARRLTAWLEVDRCPRGELLPVIQAQETASRVASWAMGHARGAEEGDGPQALTEAFRVAAAQAAALGEMLARQGSALSEPQLARLLEATLSRGIETQLRAEAAGGPRWAANLAEIPAPCARLIWLGLGTGDLPASHWTVQELAQFGAAGIDLDDGSRTLAALREAERRGFARIREALLAVALPADEEQRPHPIWLQVQGALAESEEKDPLALEDLVVSGKAAALPWRFPVAATAVRSPQPPRSHWSLPPGLLPGRDRSSASELESRLACPLQWTFKYAARLGAGSIARLPGDFRLKGSLCHDILRLVFGEGGRLPESARAEAQVRRALDERLPLDAAPLAQPAFILDRLRLADELARATRTLVEVLRAGRYQVVGMEVPIEGTVDGRQLEGFIDCLVRRDDGAEAILDFKYQDSRDGKYRRLLRDGRSVQLATYAEARRQATGGVMPAVGYLILADGLLYTPEASALAGGGGTVIDGGPSIAAVWDGFAAALAQAENWLAGGIPVPARPLEDPEEWPEGSAIVLDPPDAKGKLPDTQPICKYCDYGCLCGLTELT